MPIFLKACHSIISFMSNGLMNRDRLDMTYRGGGLEGQGKEGKRRKDDPGPVMVSDTLCPAVHILGT